MFAEDISEDRRYHFCWILEYFWIDIEIFAEDCFLLKSFRKFLPSGCLPLSRFQYFEEAFCAPKVRLNGMVSRVFPLIALSALAAFFHSTPGAAQHGESRCRSSHAESQMSLAQSF